MVGQLGNVGLKVWRPLAKYPFRKDYLISNLFKLLKKRIKTKLSLVAYSVIMRHHNALPLDIETHVDQKTFDLLQSKVEDTWSRLGHEDAYWSVLTDEQFRKEKNPSGNPNFFKQCESDVISLDASLKRVGTCLSDIDTAIDFGCGVGRLSIALAKKVGHVSGVDISTPHLREAKANIEHLGFRNIELIKSSCLSDIRGLRTANLVLSVIVLQHNPPPVMLAILEALCSRVKQGGYLYVQAQTYLSGYSYSAKEHLKNSTTKLEMHIIPQHVFLAAIQRAGLTILEVMEDGAAGNLNYKSQTVLAYRK